MDLPNTQKEALGSTVKKERQHIHRCPICDRFKKVVRANLKLIHLQALELYKAARDEEYAYLSDTKIQHLAAAISRPALNIHRLFSVCHVKKIQKMTDEEAAGYIVENFIEPDWKPFVAWKPGQELCDDSPEGEAQEGPSRPKLTLLQGGKGLKTSCGSETCNI